MMNNIIYFLLFIIFIIRKCRPIISQHNAFLEYEMRFYDYIGFYTDFYCQYKSLKPSSGCYTQFIR